MGWKAPLAILAVAAAALLIGFNTDDSVVTTTASPAPLDQTIDGETGEFAALRPGQTTSAQTAPTETKRVAHPATTGSWTLSGTTTLGWRQPMPLAKVEIKVFAGYQATGTAVQTLTTQSDAHGRFSISTQAPRGTVTVLARPGIEGVLETREQRVVVFEQPPPTDLHVTILPLDRKLLGQIVDAAGKGLTTARVQIRHGEEALVCDDAGRFEASVSSAERLRLQAAAPGYAVTRAQVPMPKSGDPGPVRIELQPGFTIRGRVVDERGDPVAGADVTTFDTSFFAHQTTDADGKFRIDYLHRSRRSHIILARHQGYVGARAQVESGDAKDSYELVMKRGVRVEGSVLDAHGDPVPGAPLYLGFDPSAYDRLDARADDDGQFVFPTVGPGEHDLVVEVRGHAPRKMKLVVPERVATLPGVIVQLEAAHFIAGTVVDAAGQALDGIHAHARLPSEQDGDDRYIGEGIACQADGTFRLENLPSGTVDIEFYGKDTLHHVERSACVDQTAARITLERAAKLAGRVLDAVSQQPLQKFRIKIIRASSGGYRASWLRGHDLAADDGRWRSDNDQFKPGISFVVEATAKGYGRVLKQMKATIEADPDATVFELPPGQTVRGQVRAQDSGLPVEGARVIMFGELDPIRVASARDLETRLTTTTGADGKFILRDAPIGRISLAIRHPDYPHTSDGPFDITARIPTERAIQLARSAQISGSIVDNGGQPIPGARLLLARLDAGSLNKTTVGRCRWEISLCPGTAGRQVSAKPRPRRLGQTAPGFPCGVRTQGRRTAPATPDAARQMRPGRHHPLPGRGRLPTQGGHGVLLQARRGRRGLLLLQGFERAVRASRPTGRRGQFAGPDLRRLSSLAKQAAKGPTQPRPARHG